MVESFGVNQKVSTESTQHQYDGSNKDTGSLSSEAYDVCHWMYSRIAAYILRSFLPSGIDKYPTYRCTVFKLTLRSPPSIFDTVWGETPKMAATSLWLRAPRE
jgi:hypothetical protein